MLAVAKKPKAEGSAEDRSNRKSAPIQVEKDLARKVAVIATHRQISQSALISPVIRRFVETQYAIVSGEIQKEVAERKAEGSEGG